MKVLHILSSNKYSGAENVACQIISMFDDGEVEFAYASPDGEIKNSLSERGIKFLPMTKMCKNEVKKVINEFKPDVIHAHDPRAICMATLVSKHIKIVGHVHNNRPDFRKKTLLSMLFTYCVKKNIVQELLWVSNSCYDCFYAKNNKKIKNKSQVLNNIINTESLAKKANQAEITEGADLVYLGRLTYQKNPERLVQIVQIIKNDLPNIKLAVIGSGDLQEKVQGLSKEYGLEDNIKFYGFLNNGYAILKNSKVFLLTSRFEGNPMCVLEAQSFGLPIVTTEIGELKTLVKQDETGYFYVTNEEAAKYILGLLTNSKIYKKIKTNTSNFSKTYNNIDQFKGKMLNLYKHCLNG